MIESRLAKGWPSMARSKPIRTPQIAEDLCQRIDALRDIIGVKSFNGFTEQLLEQMVQLAETSPDQRTVPPICLALDAIRGVRPALRPSSIVDQAVHAAAVHSVSHVKSAKK